MSSDPNKKSARTFQCRDSLWETFEDMAQELECSVDYLISEAMKQYARQRGQIARPPVSRPDAPLPAEAPVMRAPTPAAAPLPPLPAAPPPPVPGRASALPPLPLSARPGAAPLPPPPAGPPSRATIQHAPPPPLPPPSRMAPPPLPPVAAPQGAQLSVIYAGEKVPVSKEQFIIGRGKQSSDLTIRDQNISRQHAMVELANGQYFMVDLGSTNGVEQNGQRINRKAIVEGDVFYICNHEIRFTYR